MNSWAMYETCGFVSILQIIYICFTVFSSSITRLIVNIWRGGFSSHFPDVTGTVGIWPSRFFIIGFYYTLINIFWDFRAFKHVNICFKSNIFTIKSLNVQLLAPTIRHIFNKISFSSVTHFFHLSLTQVTQPSTH